MSQPEEIDFETYATRHGASRLGFGDPALHGSAQGVARSTWQRFAKTQAQRDTQLQARRDQLRADYDQAVARGEIKPPSRIAQLRQVASGNPDRADVQAARRILAKLGQPVEVAD